jgi:hypothetical protein
MPFLRQTLSYPSALRGGPLGIAVQAVRHGPMSATVWSPALVVIQWAQAAA